MAKKKAVQEKSGRSKTEADETTFEESLASLEKIVAQLESGELGLGKSLEAYEKGIGQLKKCHQLLAAAERRVEILSGVDADGNPVLRAFEACGGGQAEPSERDSAGRRNSEELF